VYPTSYFYRRGGSDLPSYYEKFGSFFISAAIDRTIKWREGATDWLSSRFARVHVSRIVITVSPTVGRKSRWRIERDYQELKQGLGLGHFEGRGWRGIHHHATLCIAAYGFLISERETIPPVDLVPPRCSRNLPYPTVTDPGCVKTRKTEMRRE
jgi:hypothetical protein